MKGIRLDQYLVDNNMVPSRERGRALIMAGIVYINGDKADKAGMPVPENASVEIRGKDIGYVSRGGLKLEKAMQTFPISLQGAICMDIGASTGGFTDCMLQNGAQKVYAVDVGYGQLAWSLRTDERVVNLERTNIRHLNTDIVQQPLDFFSVDVSFISLKHVFPVAAKLTRQEGTGVCLVKPQFEAGKEKVGKKGVVREASTHLEVLQNAQQYATDNGFSVLGCSFSPIKGPQGNIEFLLYVSLSSDTPQELSLQKLESVVQLAHTSLEREEA